MYYECIFSTVVGFQLQLAIFTTCPPSGLWRTCVAYRFVWSWIIVSISSVRMERWVIFENSWLRSRQMDFGQVPWLHSRSMRRYLPFSFVVFWRIAALMVRFSSFEISTPTANYPSLSSHPLFVNSSRVIHAASSSQSAESTLFSGIQTFKYLLVQASHF